MRESLDKLMALKLSSKLHGEILRGSKKRGVKMSVLIRMILRRGLEEGYMDIPLPDDILPCQFQGKKK